jgi:hypothetical protein
MQSLAKQFNLSETTFVLPSDSAMARADLHPHVRDAVRGPSYARHGARGAMLRLSVDAIRGSAFWVDTGVEQLVVLLRTADDVRRAAPAAALLAPTGHSERTGESMAYVWAPAAGGEVLARFIFLVNGALVEGDGLGAREPLRMVARDRREAFRAVDRAPGRLRRPPVTPRSPRRRGETHPRHRQRDRARSRRRSAVNSTFAVFNGESPIQPDSGGSFAPLEMLRISSLTSLRLRRTTWLRQVDFVSERLVENLRS